MPGTWQRRAENLRPLSRANLAVSARCLAYRAKNCGYASATENFEHHVQWVSVRRCYRSAGSTCGGRCLRPVPPRADPEFRLEGSTEGGQVGESPAVRNLGQRPLYSVSLHDSRRQPSSRRLRIDRDTVVPCSAKARCNCRMETLTDPAMSTGDRAGSAMRASMTDRADS